MSDSSTVVQPSDCALVISVPLSLSELEEVWSRGDSEFAKIVTDKTGSGSPEQAWSRGYSEACETVEEIILSVEALGVKVVTNATSRDLPEVFGKYSQVSILCHGPHPHLPARDVLHPGRLLSAFHEAKRGRISHPVVLGLIDRPEIARASSAAQLIKGINLLIKQTKSFFNAETEEPTAGITRMLLHEALPGIIRPPAILEFNKSYVNFEEFVACIPDNYSGSIDFVTCSALWFSEALRRRCPTLGDITCPRKPAEFVTRAKFYQYIVKLLACRPSSFAEASRAVHWKMLDIQKHHLEEAS